MSGLACILVGGIGVLFTIMANRMGAGFLSLIGVFFVIFAVMQGGLPPAKRQWGQPVLPVRHH